MYLSLTEQLFGSHQHLYAAWSAALACLFSVCVYVLLRVVRLRPLDAGLIGLLVLVFPAGDATRAWPIVSDAQVAMSLVLLGVSCSISSLSAAGRRAVGLRIGGLLLIAFGVTLYELTLVALLLCSVLYRTRAPWRRSLLTSAVDWVMLALIYFFFTRHTIIPRTPVSQTLSHAWTITSQAATLLSTRAMPFGSTAAGLAAAGLILAAALVVRRLLSAGDPTRVGIDRWLITGAIGVVMLAAAYGIYAPSAPSSYLPLQQGEFNRTNAFAAVPMLVIVYSLAALLGLLVVRGARDRRTCGAAITSAIAIGLGVGYTIAIAHDLRLWDSAYARAHATLVGFQSRIPSVPPGSLIVFYGQPFQEASNIPIWSYNYDLTGALDLEFHVLGLQGSGSLPGLQVVCEAHRARLVDTAYALITFPDASAPYGSFFMYQTNTGVVGLPLNRPQCLREAPQFIPGPYNAPNPGGDDPPL